jgi:hypothetical protein
MALKTSDFIQRAYRTQNLIPVGKAPTAAEIQEALGLYQSMIASLFGGNDIGQLLAPWEIPPDPTSTNPGRYPLYPQQPNQDNQQQVWRNPPPNVRLIANQGIGDPVFFPPTPPNGSKMAFVNVGLDLTQYPLTLSGNGRLIEGQPDITIDNTYSGPILWFYRDDLANWVRVTDLELTSDSPLPPQFDNFIRCLLFANLAGPNNKEVADETTNIIQHGHRLLKTTYLSTNPGATFPGAWRMNTYQGYGTPWRFGGGSFG